MKSLNTMEHLNDEQFSALLAGEEMAGAQTHLDGCAECRTEMERVGEAMASFSGMTLEWAEVRSATMPAVQPQERAAWLRPVAWASATAVLALVVAAGVRHEHPADVPVQVAQMVAPAVMAPVAAPTIGVAPAVRHLTRAQQIAADNRMLLAIRQELAQPQTVRLPRAAAGNARGSRMVND